jgi:hypothetical protein
MRYTFTEINRNSDTISSVDEALELFDLRAYTLVWDDIMGQSMWFAPADGDDELRVDIDLNAELAMLTWLPDGTYGIELEPTAPLTIVWYADAPPVTIPAELARVSPETARQAVTEYITTGVRPTCVRWEKQPQGMSYTASSTSQFGPV